MATMALMSMSVRGSHHSHREEGDEVREQASEGESAGPSHGKHVPVMQEEVIVALEPKAGDVVLDATYGAGGHSAALRKAAKVRLVALDADPAAGADLTANFADLKHVLKSVDIGHIDKVLFDLGWNMNQLSSGRGFSFLRDEPLNMSYGPSPRSGFTAAQILNTFSESAIADILFGYGEERYARRIASNIVRHRQLAPFVTTFELVEAVRDSVPPSYRHGRLNPATRTFQALRIAVNDELGVLKAGLQSAWDILTPGGRIVVISFHSVEDRLVKNLFKKFASPGGTLLYKKPLVASRAEVSANPKSRSAKLRAIQKV